MRCMGTVQLLKLQDQLGYCQPNFLFHNFHKTESIILSDVLHVEGKPQRWGETVLTQHPEEGGCRHWFRISLSGWISWPFLVCNMAAAVPTIKWTTQGRRRKGGASLIWSLLTRNRKLFQKLPPAPEGVLPPLSWARHWVMCPSQAAGKAGKAII